MRERIILAPGLNGTELTRSLAMHGVNCIGLRICNAAELARLALMRSGISIAEDFVSAREETAIAAEAAAGEPYFGRTSYSDIQEIASAIRRMRCLAASADEEGELERALSAGIFKEKNAALMNVYRRYMAILRQKNALDAVSLIRKAAEEARVISAEFLTLSEYPLNPIEKVLLNKVSGGSVRETCIRELFGVRERSIHIESIKNCYGAPNEVETILTDIYARKEQGERLTAGDPSCCTAQATPEERAAATATLDQCTVAVTDADTYGQLFYDYALLYDIPVTFGCGIPIANSNPARLTALYYKWITGGFFGADAINEMLSSDAFDRVKLFGQLSGRSAEACPAQSAEACPAQPAEAHPAQPDQPGGEVLPGRPEGTAPARPENFSRRTFMEVLGSLRLTNDAETNRRRVADFKRAVREEAELIRDEKSKEYRHIRKKLQCIPALETAAEELALPVEEFVSKYSRIRKGSDTNAERLTMMLDLSAAGAIYEELKVIRSSGVGQSVDDILPNILRLRVCAQRSEAGKLHVTGIEGAFAAMRDQLYIAGLSASNYPGSPREDYLLLDCDLKMFGDEAKRMTAEEKVVHRRNQLLSLVSLASALGTGVYVSFAGLNVSELKKDNPSSLVYELFRGEKGSDATSAELEEKIRKVDYFEPAISATRLVGRAYTQGHRIVPAASEAGQTDPVPWDLEKAWSPTALDTFFGCPRRFMLGYILGIPEPDETDPFEIMTALDTGTLAHSLMEALGNSSMSRDEFMELAGEYFDRFLAEHPPLIGGNAAPVRDGFMEMMETAYETDPHREVVLGEEDISCEHESGVRIHGFPDRVEKLEDGSHLVVDFKSGRRVAHVQDDIGTCLQVVIYAYLMERKGFRVSGGEYRYIRTGETVTCRYDEDMKRQLGERLEAFREALLKGDFPAAAPSEENEDPCRYCKYIGICGMAEEQSADGEGGEI